MTVRQLLIMQQMCTSLASVCQAATEGQNPDALVSDDTKSVIRGLYFSVQKSGAGLRRSRPKTSTAADALTRRTR